MTTETSTTAISSISGSNSNIHGGANVSKQSQPPPHQHHVQKRTFHQFETEKNEQQNSENSHPRRFGKVNKNHINIQLEKNWFIWWKLSFLLWLNVLFINSWKYEIGFNRNFDLKISENRINCLVCYFSVLWMSRVLFILFSFACENIRESLKHDTDDDDDDDLRIKYCEDAPSRQLMIFPILTVDSRWPIFSPFTLLFRIDYFFY